MTPTASAAGATVGDRNRTWWALGAGLVGVGCVAALAPWHGDLSQTTPALLLVVPVIVAAAVGGSRPALVVAAVAALVWSVAFIPPVGSLHIRLPEDTVAFLVFATVAATVGAHSGRESEQRRRASRRGDDLAELNTRLVAALAERDRLEAEVRRRAVLEHVDQQRRALLRAVSHDLRTPLGTIIAASDAAQATDGDVAQRAQLLDLVGREARRLERIVANLLSYGRIEAGAFRPDLGPVDLADVVHDAIGRLGAVLAPLDVRLELPDDLPAVSADHSQIDQVLTNLIENAARHSDPGAAVHIAAACDDGAVEVAVVDHGDGIDPAAREAAFEPFRSGDRSTGIGLAICRAIVAEHGGRIWLSETAGGGASVHFTLAVDG